MYENFLSAWVQSESGAKGSYDRPTKPLCLWVYGRDPCLTAFTREIVAFMKKKRRRLGIATTARIASDLDPAVDGGADPNDRELAVELRKDLESAPVLLLGLDPAALAGRTLFWIDGLVNKRYAARRCTVVLCSFDPVAAYESQFPGQDEFTMPRIVGRILELGDAVEVTDDGAYCAEFVFSEKAAADYRIKILKDRVGRVAIMRPRDEGLQDDDEEDDDDDGEDWKRGPPGF